MDFGNPLRHLSDSSRGYSEPLCRHGRFRLLFPITAYDESDIVGHLIIRFTDESKTEARFGFVMVDDAKRGRGYGTDTLFRDGAFTPNG